MKIRMPYYYKDFKCIASKCTDTCCAGWQIVIDEDTYSKYKNVKSDFGKRLNSEIIRYEDDEPGFKLKNNNCAFLNKDLLCDIYSNLGEEYLCHTCKTFPRIIEEYGSLRETTLSLSCPESARLILKDSKKLTFEVTENDEFVTSYNTISADLYIQILGAREVAFYIIQNTTFDLNMKLSILLLFAEDIQKKIDECEISKIAHIRKKYLDQEFLNNLALSLLEKKSNIKEKHLLLKQFFNIFSELEELNIKWTETLNNSSNILFNNNDFSFYETNYKKFNEYYKNNLYEFENIFTYFLFRYFMKSLHDADLLSKIKLCIISTIIIETLEVTCFINNDFNFSFEDSIEISHLYSKNIEHCDDNIEKLYNMFNELEIFNTANFLTILN